MKAVIDKAYGEISCNLTKGKEYEVIKVKYVAAGLRSFWIRFDGGDEHYCLDHHCFHLNGGSWRFIKDGSDESA